MSRGGDDADAERAWRWFLACTLASASCGMSYAFSAFSSALKAEWHLSQPELESISVAGNLAAGLLGGALGMLVDAAVPARSMAGGGALSAIAYAAYWAIAARRVPIGALPPVLALGACVALAACGVSVVMTTVVALLVRTMPSHERGVLIGLMKAYVGIAAGGLAIVFQGATGRTLGGDGVRALDFVLAVALEVALVTLLPACFLPRRPMRALRAVPDALSSARARALLTRRTAIVSCCLGAMLVAMAVGALVAGARRSAGAAFVVFWLAPLLLTQRGALACADGAARAALARPRARCLLTATATAGRPTAPAHGNERNERVALLAPADTDGGARGVHERDHAPSAAVPAPRVVTPCASRACSAAVLEGARVCEMARTRECWAIVFIVSALFGGGMMVSTNLAQLLGARGERARTGGALAIFSIGSALGRALGGLGADALRLRLGLPATACFAVDCALMICAHALLAGGASAPPLLSGVLLAGLSFGATWPHVVLVASECYGTAHLGANYGFFDGLCQACGSLLLAKLLPGHVYARAAAALAPAHGAGGGGEAECVGAPCFGDAHRAIIVLCALGLCASAWLELAQAARARNGQTGLT
ncbi:hypothetical protein KFE25_014209 [Diacronema lutheri]|uniref:Nodulin-like domain-containing protein n=1 Tax=Diacronema lutheri TaxID=2081491 RepID=A0A8J5X9U8_DIALT|nr:hypothetical protein KFE25_014209 [Diacronema lutheri]